MDSSFTATWVGSYLATGRSSGYLSFPVSFCKFCPLFCTSCFSLSVVCLLPYSTASAEGDAAAGKAAWIKTCDHCHGNPQPNSSDAFSDYDTTANKLSVYASDPAAITKAANEGYTIPAGNTNDKAEPGKNTNDPMGTWASDAPNKLGLGTTPTQYAINFSAYFATFYSVPAAPTISSVIAGNAQASVSFNPPKSDLTITSYTVTSNPGGITAKGKVSPINVTGLINGTAYKFTVAATSNAGTGPYSASSNPVIPVATGAIFASNSAPVAVTTNNVPTAVVAKAGNAQAKIYFSIPAGVQNISSFTVNVFSGGTTTTITATGTKSPIVVTGLSNQTTYSFTVTAHGNSGESFTSTRSNAVTPLTILGD